MHGASTSRSFPPCPALSYARQIDFPSKSCADACDQTPCTHSDNERAIQGTWCSVELEKALEKGYRILQVHEVWHFPQSSDELFKEYVDTFLKIKQESSGYPKNCTTEEQRQQYVDEYLAVEGIQLDRSKIEDNPGMRALSKLMLNLFWGMYFKQCMLFQTFFRWHPNRWKVIATNIHNIFFLHR